MLEKIIVNMVANRYQKGKSDMEQWITGVAIVVMNDLGLSYEM